MLRDDVLLLLTEAEGYVSGEEMREKLGVTRAAVSQAVRALRAAGYDIDAVTGDILSYDYDVFNSGLYSILSKNLPEQKVE